MSSNGRLISLCGTVVTAIKTTPTVAGINVGGQKYSRFALARWCSKHNYRICI